MKRGVRVVVTLAFALSLFITGCDATTSAGQNIWDFISQTIGNFLQELFSGSINDTMLSFVVGVLFLILIWAVFHEMIKLVGFFGGTGKVNNAGMALTFAASTMSTLSIMLYAQSKGTSLRESVLNLVSPFGTFGALGIAFLFGIMTFYSFRDTEILEDGIGKWFIIGGSAISVGVGFFYVVTGKPPVLGFWITFLALLLAFIFFLSHVLKGIGGGREAEFENFGTGGIAPPAPAPAQPPPPPGSGGRGQQQQQQPGNRRGGGSGPQPQNQRRNVPNSNYKPVMGFWQVPFNQVSRVVAVALTAGYEEFDTSDNYGDTGHQQEDPFEHHGERVLGTALEHRDVKTVYTKIDPQHYHEIEARVQRAQELFRGKDLIIMLHWPGEFRGRDREGDYVVFHGANGYAAYQELVRLTGSRASVSNFGVSHLQEIMDIQKPHLNQIEINPLLQQTEIIEYCKQNGILVQAFSPLASGLLNDHPTVLRIAQEHNKTFAQVLIRYAYQKGADIVNVKTTNPQRMIQNLDINDFILTDQNMANLNALRNDSAYLRGTSESAPSPQLFPPFDHENMRRQREVVSRLKDLLHEDLQNILQAASALEQNTLGEHLLETLQNEFRSYGSKIIEVQDNHDLPLQPYSRHHLFRLAEEIHNLLEEVEESFHRSNDEIQTELTQLSNKVQEAINFVNSL